MDRQTMNETPDKNGLELSLLTEEDLSSIAAHYAHEVQTGVATFDTSAPGMDYWQNKLVDSQSNAYPIWVARDAQGRVAGWSGVGRFDPKLAYQRSAEFSVYVLDAYQGKGVGRMLMRHALAQLKNHSTIKTLVSRIALQQEASLHLHQVLGFKHIGTLEDVGFKFGKTLSVALYQYQLAVERGLLA